MTESTKKIIAGMRFCKENFSSKRDDYRCKCYSCPLYLSCVYPSVSGHAFLSLEAIDELLAHLPKWIPVTERLPKPFVTVLVTHKQENGTLYKHMAHLNPQGRWAGLSYTGEVTAWMPLPEPWEGEV